MSIATAFQRLTRPVKHLYERFREPDVHAETKRVMDMLEQTDVFANLSRRACRDLAASMHRRHYQRDEVIYYQNDPCLGLYLLEEGRVRLRLDAQDTLADLHDVSAPATIGIPGLLGATTHAHTALAVTEATLLGFFKPDLATLTQRHPRSGVEVLSALARAVSQQHGRLLDAVAGQLEPADAVVLLATEVSASDAEPVEHHLS